MKLVAGWWFPDWEKHFQEFWGPVPADSNPPVPYQEAQRTFALNFVSNWKTVIDVGGNVGTWSNPMSKKFSTVHAFEPHPENRECYLKNMADIKNFTLHPYALSDREGTFPLYIHDTSCGNISLDVDGVLNGPTKGKPNMDNIKEIQVEVKTLDSFNFTDVGFIKIDVQGHEHGVLKGATRLLTEQNPVLCLELPQRYPEEIQERNRITQWLLNYGYAIRGNRGKETVYTK